jgi:uncharacterized protein (TIGR02118 family)
MDREEALRYWKDDHVLLVENVPLLKGYVQNLCVVGPDGAEPAYAGLGEVWFDSFEDAERATQSPEWAAVTEDARAFMDVEHLVVAWAEENVGVTPKF